TKGLDCLRGKATFSLCAHHSDRRELLERSQREVLAHRIRQDQALSLTVFRYDHDPGPYGVAGSLQPDRTTISQDRAGSRGTDATQRVGQAGAAGADEPCEAQHLAGVKLEADRVAVVGGRGFGQLQPDILLCLFVYLTVCTQLTDG